MGNENKVIQLNELYKDFLSGKINRRALMLKAAGLGLTGYTMTQLARTVPASAQDATPEAMVLEGGFQSITYAEYRASLAEDFPFTAGNQPTGGILIHGDSETSNITTINPHFADNAPTQDLNLQVFETLFGNDPRDAQYVPLLADRWEIAEDGRTYTFYLQENVTFHDGSPFTSADVDLSFGAQADETTGSSYTSTFNSAVESWSAIDDYTFEVVATDIFSQVIFLGTVFVPIVSANLWGDLPYDQWQLDGGSTGSDPSRVAGTGYLKFVEIDEGQGITRFARNENYWWADDIPSVEEYIFAVWPDDTASIEALRSGEIDFLEAVPPADVAGIQEQDGLDVALYDTYSFSWYGTNLDPEKTLLFQDVEVRQAMMFAVDRDSMVENIMLSYAEVAQGTQPVLSPAYAPDQIDTIYTYDPDGAADLLEEAGWTLNADGVREKDGNALSFEIMYPGGSATSEQIAVALQDYWKAVGLDGQPNPVDFDTVLVPALVETFDFEVVLLGFNWDPTGDQRAMFHTDSYGGGFNAMRYSNPEYDQLADAAAVELDPDASVALTIEATNIVNEDVPVGVLWFRQDRVGYATRMENFTPNGVSLLWSIPYVNMAE